MKSPTKSLIITPRPNFAVASRIASWYAAANASEVTGIAESARAWHMLKIVLADEGDGIPPAGTYRLSKKNGREPHSLWIVVSMSVACTPRDLGALGDLSDPFFLLGCFGGHISNKGVMPAFASAERWFNAHSSPA